MHDMMMLKVCQQNLTLSIHVLCVHKVVSKIEMKMFKIARLNTIGVRMSLARVSQGIKGHNHFHQKSTGVVHNNKRWQVIERGVSRVETIHMKLC
jgi:hypothetical protein